MTNEASSYYKLLAKKKIEDAKRGKIGVEVTATELECMKELIDVLMQLDSDMNHVSYQRKAGAMKDDELEAALENLCSDIGSPVLQAFERLESVLFLRDTQD